MTNDKSSEFGWETVRVFISSTFRDFHAERDYLLKWVFPEIREWCRQMKLHFIDIDLRWGITEEQANNGSVIDLCLREIDQSRPFFICMLGSRYGWVPVSNEIPDSTLYLYPDLFGENRQLSVTNMEIHHSFLSRVMNEETIDTEALFYFRSKMPEKESFTNLSNEAANVYEKTFFDKENWKFEVLNTLKEDIRSKYKKFNLDKEYICDYSPIYNPELSNPEDPKLPGRIIASSLSDFGNHVNNNLKKVINQRFKERYRNLVKEGVKHSEDDLHNFFAEERSINFLGREKEIDKMFDYLKGTSTSFLAVFGEAGTGKSSLLSHFYKLLLKNPNYSGNSIIAHFVGASSVSTSVYNLLGRLCELLFKNELKEKMAMQIKSIKDEINDISNNYNGNDKEEKLSKLNTEIHKTEEKYKIPQTLSELEIAFKEFIAMLEKPHLIIIDALNQLDSAENVNSLSWIPVTIPTNVKIIISSIEGSTANLIKAKTSNHLEISQLEEDDSRKIIEAIPSIFAKTLDVNHINTLLAKQSSRNPLFLSIALEELRLFGSFDQLNEKISNLPDQIDALFIKVIERLENDFGCDIIESVFCLIECSRSGLTEHELKELTLKVDVNNDLMVILRHLRNYLVYRGDLIDFYHRIISKAVRKKYLSHTSYSKRWHAELANYFNSSNYIIDDKPNKRKVFEITYQQQLAGDYAAMNYTLSEIEYKTLCTNIYGIKELLDRFESNKIPDETCSIIHSALRYSEKVLSFHPNQLITQLYNRLVQINSKHSINYLRQIEKNCPKPYIVDQGYCLRQPAQSSIIPQKYHQSTINSICYAQQHNLVITSDIHGRVVFWNLQTLTPIHISDEHDILAYCNVTQNSSIIITSDLRGKIIAWDISVTPTIKWVKLIDKSTDDSKKHNGMHSVSYSLKTNVLSYSLNGSAFCFSYNLNNDNVSILAFKDNKVVEANKSDINSLKGLNNFTFVSYFNNDESRICRWGDSIVVIKGEDYLNAKVLPVLSNWQLLKVINNNNLALVNNLGVLYICDLLSFEYETFRITNRKLSDVNFIDNDNALFVDDTGFVVIKWNRIKGSAEYFMQNRVSSTIVLNNNEYLVCLYNGEIVPLLSNNTDKEIQYKNIMVSLSKDAEKAISVDKEGGIFVHLLERNHDILNELYGDEIPSAFAISTQGIVALGLNSGNVVLWDPGSDDIEEFEVTKNRITCCKFSTDEQYVVLGDVLGKVALMNIETCNIISEKMHSSPIRFVSFYDNKSVLLSGSWGGIKKHILNNNQLISATLSITGTAIGAFSQGDLIVLFQKNQVLLIDSMSCETISSLESAQKAALHCVIHENEICIYSEYMLEIFDISTNEKLGELTTDIKIIGIDYSAGKIAIVLDSGYISFAELQNLEKRRKISTEFKHIQSFVENNKGPSVDYSKNYATIALSVVGQKTDKALFKIWDEAIKYELRGSELHCKSWDNLSRIEKYMCTRNTLYHYNLLTKFNI